VMATDLRIVADNARLLSGFLRIGVHPGEGHFVLLARAAGREVAAAMGIFGEELDGSAAPRVGLAWQSLPDVDVELRAFELVQRAAADPSSHARRSLPCVKRSGHQKSAGLSACKQSELVRCGRCGGGVASDLRSQRRCATWHAGLVEWAALSLHQLLNSKCSS
jgi:enoyl-CoA hydratase/carnithine racemase